MSRTVETPSGKGAGDENFPVGSWLLPAELRPHVACFYAFARAIDDIADNSDLAPEDKVGRLEGFARALTDPDGKDPAYEKANRLRRSLAETGVVAQHGLDLIAAFKQDARKQRYDDWSDLMGYCALSANPVGRYLLDLHGEARADYPPSDALCSALQVINHLQDCQDDYRNLDRVYLPRDWMAEAGMSLSDLDAPAANDPLRRVIDRCLDGVDELLRQAQPLPERLVSRRLAMESSVIWGLAERLSHALRRRDPLAERVVLGRLTIAWCAVSAVVPRVFRHKPRRPDVVNATEQG